MGIWSDYMETETYDNDEEVVEDIDNKEFDDSGWGINEYSPSINIEQMIRDKNK